MIFQESEAAEKEEEKEALLQGALRQPQRHRQQQQQREGERQEQKQCSPRRRSRADHDFGRGDRVEAEVDTQYRFI